MWFDWRQWRHTNVVKTTKREREYTRKDEEKEKTKQSPRLVTLLAHSFAFWLHLTRARALAWTAAVHIVFVVVVASFRIRIIFFRSLSTPRIINFLSVFLLLFLFSFSICYFNSIWNTIYYLFFIQIKISSKFALLPWFLRKWKNCVHSLWSSPERELDKKVSILWAAHTHTHTHHGGEFGCRIHQIVSFYFV